MKLLNTLWKSNPNKSLELYRKRRLKAEEISKFETPLYVHGRHKFDIRKRKTATFFNYSDVIDKLYSLNYWDKRNFLDYHFINTLTDKNNFYQHSKERFESEIDRLDTLLYDKNNIPNQTVLDKKLALKTSVFFLDQIYDKYKDSERNALVIEFDKLVIENKELIKFQSETQTKYNLLCLENKKLSNENKEVLELKSRYHELEKRSKEKIKINTEIDKADFHKVFYKMMNTIHPKNNKPLIAERNIEALCRFVDDHFVFSKTTMPTTDKNLYKPSNDFDKFDKSIIQISFNL